MKNIFFFKGEQEFENEEKSDNVSLLVSDELKSLLAPPSRSLPSPWLMSRLRVTS